MSDSIYSDEIRNDIRFIKEQLNDIPEIKEQLKRIDISLRGNGGIGLKGRLKILEDTEQNRKHWSKAIWTATLTALGGVVLLLFKTFVAAD